jgi:hypothetical protein
MQHMLTILCQQVGNCGTEAAAAKHGYGLLFSHKGIRFGPCAMTIWTALYGPRGQRPAFSWLSSLARTDRNTLKRAHATEKAVWLG